MMIPSPRRVDVLSKLLMAVRVCMVIVDTELSGMLSIWDSLYNSVWNLRSKLLKLFIAAYYFDLSSVINGHSVIKLDIFHWILMKV